MKPRIITLLKLAGPDGIPTFALRLEYELRFKKKPEATDFDIALQELETGGFITSKVDVMTDDKYWKLTEAKKK